MNERSWAMVTMFLAEETNAYVKKVVEARGNIALRALSAYDPEMNAICPWALMEMAVFPGGYIEDADLSQQCSCTIYTIVESLDKLDEFIPAEVEVKRLSTTPQQTFWPGTADATAAYRAQKAAANAKNKRSSGNGSHLGSHAVPLTDGPSGIGGGSEAFEDVYNGDPGDCGGRNGEGGCGGGEGEDEVDTWATRLHGGHVARHSFGTPPKSPRNNNNTNNSNMNK